MREWKTVLQVSQSDAFLLVSTIALSDPPRIGQADPLDGVGNQGKFGCSGLAGADRPSGSTRLNGWFIMLSPQVDCSSWTCGVHLDSEMKRLRESVRVRHGVADPWRRWRAVDRQRARPSRAPSGSM